MIPLAHFPVPPPNHTHQFLELYTQCRILFRKCVSAPKQPPTSVHNSLYIQQKFGIPRITSARQMAEKLLNIPKKTHS